VKPPLRIGIIGLGGFAGSHHHALLRLEELGEARLVCTCDPDPGAFAHQQLSLRFPERGVQVFSDYRAMLESCHGALDVVVTPTPIHLHAETHAAATSLGLPVYVEKPPTLDYAELENMIAADARARKASLVGFNFIIEKVRLSLKQRLLDGEFGAIRGATLSALWPRPASYFFRNHWAGRLMLDGRVVLDSCFGNAMAHFVHNLLFWTGGPDLFSWAQVVAVRAELYRAHPIDGADTFFVEADTTCGVTLRFALSHACAGPSTQCEMVLCEQAVVRYTVGRHIEIRWNDGRVEKTVLEPFDPLVENHLDYFRYLRGEKPRPATTLADSRPFVALNDLAHISSGHIAPIPPALVTTARDEKEQKDYFNVPAMAAAHAGFLMHGEWPSWDRQPGEVVTSADLPRFHDVVRAMDGQ
jgi:predicted dehydrogenase